MAGEKTEKATPKRKQDERKKGNIFQSREVVTVASMVILFYSLKFLAPSMQANINRFTMAMMDDAAVVTEINYEYIVQLFIRIVAVFAMVALPLLLISALVAIVITFAQTRLLFSTQSLAPKASRINPLSGLKKMFSLRSIVELFKSLAKISVLGYIVYLSIMELLPSIPRTIDMDITHSVALVGDTVFSIVSKTAVVFVFLAAADYAYQWWDYEKNLRMSKQEIKEEYKQAEGDPQIKGKIKERQRQQAMARMMQRVPQADVVIRNPTHFAVALKYDPDSNRAPVVVAKGADHMALKIVAIAEENDVFITENKPLARGLYEAVDLDREIPDKFYQAVAEVLAFVYSLKKKELK